MGDIPNNIKAAPQDKSDNRNGNSNTQASQKDNQTIMGKPIILKHSLEEQMNTDVKTKRN